MSQEQEFLYKYLQMISSYGNNNTAEKLCLKYGKPFDVPAQARPVGMKQMKARECFRNAYYAGLERGWQYVEGFAMSIVPIHHGWCIDREGQVVETTWERPGTAYYGIVIPYSVLNEALVEHGYYGVLSQVTPRSKMQTILSAYPLD